jgi:hypothetical protein
MRGLRDGLLTLLAGAAVGFGCAHTPAVAAPAPVAARASVPPLTRYLSDDAAIVFYVNLERINASSYRSSFMNAMGKFESARVPFIKVCREMYVTGHHPLPRHEYEYVSLLVSGCDERSMKAFPKDQEIQADHGPGSPKHSKLRARFEALGNGWFGMRTSQLGATLPDWSEATNPLKFTVGDADIAMRVGFPTLQRLASAARVPDAQIRVLAQTVEIRVFVRVEPVVTFSAEIEFVSDTTAEALIRILPAVIETLKGHIDVRRLGLEQALRDLKVQRSGRVVSLSITLPRFDSQKLVLARSFSDVGAALRGPLAEVRTATANPAAAVPHVDPGGVLWNVELELTRAMNFATCHGTAEDARPDALHAHMLIATDCQSHDDVAITVLTNEREPGAPFIDVRHAAFL